MNRNNLIRVFASIFVLGLALFNQAHSQYNGLLDVAKKELGQKLRKDIKLKSISCYKDSTRLLYKEVYDTLGRESAILIFNAPLPMMKKSLIVDTVAKYNTYGTMGNLIFVHTYSSDTKEKRLSEKLHYDINGFVSREIIYNRYSDPIIDREYRYNEFGNKYSDHDTLIKRFWYREDSLMVAEEDITSASRLEFAYNNKGQLIEEKRLNKDNEVTMKTKYDYNNAGLVEMISRSQYPNIPEFSSNSFTKFYYDQNGIKTKEERWSNPQYKEVYRFELSYY